ncbi:hypothetical protein [Rhizobium sp. BK176]|uniref:hypothetical protein n=1 Tax=Rhizobium sp. BK176 TaxID=2587071 RepID=UPI002167242D|nr:hypothetical protein [Rhizobium sp. BK176]MCS4089773.1 hypothetical protein [Rhizobium sp. BK176]
MEDPDSISETPARQAVGLFAASAQVPAREDVEIAAAVLCEDSDALMAMFDVTVDLRRSVETTTSTMRLGTSFERLRAFAASRIGAGDIATLERLVGGRLPEDCERRIQAAREDALLKGHHLATAADHYAADVMRSLSSLLGLPDGAMTLAVPIGFETASVRDVPFLCFLDPDMTEASYA